MSSFGNYQLQDPALRDAFERGCRHAWAPSLIRALEVRGITLSPAQRERIDSCTDSDQLEGWLERAVVAHSADEVFTDE